MKYSLMAEVDYWLSVITAMDSHIMGHGIISSCQSAATTEIVKRCWFWVYSCKQRYRKYQGLYCRLCYVGQGLVHDRLASQRHLVASAARPRSPPRSTLVTWHATWTANTSWRFSPSMARSSPSRCCPIATIRSSRVDTLTSTLKLRMTLIKLCSTWTEVHPLFHQIVMIFCA